MKRLLLTLMLLSVYCLSNAQNGTLRGKVSSKDGGISFASIVVRGKQNTGTSADDQGNYSLNLMEGDYTVIISAVGYISIKKKVQIKSGETTVLDADLSQDLLGLDQVVVTGSRSKVPMYKAPVVVSKISAKMMDVTQSLSLSEGLNFSPGLRMETNCQNCGFNQLRINGLDGPYSQILINSRPVFSALAGVYGLEMIPSNMVDRIEVVKGGGSALYGGNAIGGTVNIITKEPNESIFSVGTNLAFLRGKTPDKTIFVNGSIVNEDLSKGMSFFAYNRDRQPFDANGDGFSEMTKLKNNTFGADFFWNTTERSKLKANFNSMTEFRRGGNKFDLQPHESDITEQLRHNILGGDISFEIATEDFKHNFTIYASAQNTDRDSYYGGGGGKVNSIYDIDYIKVGGTKINFSDAKEGIEGLASNKDQEMKEKYIQEWVDANYASLSNDDKKTLVKEIQGREDYFTALNAYGESHDISSAVGVQYIYNINDRANLSLGSEYQYNHVTDDMPGYNREIDQKVGTMGNYAQLEWEVTEPLTLLLGGRYDMSKINGKYRFDTKSFDLDNTFHNFVPRITAKYDINDSWKLRLSYAQGYRVPQAFDEDLHVASVGGDAVFTRITSDLKPEKSNNYTASLNYVKAIGDWQANVVLEAFYTNLKDKFGEKEINQSGEVLVKEKVNIDEVATVKGFNMEANLAYIDKLIFQLGATIQSSKYSNPVDVWEDEDGNIPSIKSDKFMRAPNNYGFFSATYNPTEKWSLTYSGVITGSMYLVHNISEGNADKPSIRKTPTFFENNFKVSYTFETKDHYFVQLNTGVQNLFDSYQNDFDKGGDRDSTYIYGPVRPRTFFVGLKFGMD